MGTVTTVDELNILLLAALAHQLGGQRGQMKAFIALCQQLSELLS
jgi:hypothetical protein